MKKQSEPGLMNLIIILAVIVIITFSGGYMMMTKFKPKPKTEYSNGFTFTNPPNSKFWYTTIKNPVYNQEYNVEFRYPPSQLQDVSVVGNPKEFFKILQLNNLTGAYFTFNPNGNLTYLNLVAADLAKFLKVMNGVTLVAACTVNETETCYTRPIVTCKSQEDNAVVIYVKSSDKPSIAIEKNCLTLEGQGDNIIKAYTKLLFLWYGIL